MGFFTRLLADDAPSMPTRGPFDDYWYRPLGGVATDTGIAVTPENALEVSAVFACVNVIAQTMGVMPLVLYERTSDTTKRRATNHPLYPILHDQPNAWQTDVEFKETLSAWAALHGNGFGYKVYSPLGVLEEIVPIHPSLVTKIELLPTRRIRYQIRQSDGTVKAYTQDEIFHLRGLSFDSVAGVHLSKVARQAIALARAMEQFGGRYFKNDTTVGVVLQHPNQLSAEAHARLKESFGEAHGGVLNAFKPKILEEGMTLNRVTTSGKDAQLTEGRANQVVEICRYFRMPPHKIAHLIQATFSNIEHQSIEFMSDTALPWATRWEKTIKRDLIVEDEFFAQFQMQELLRGDNTARAAYLTARFNMASISPNEIRGMEGENPIVGGDRYYLNSASVPIDENGDPTPPSVPSLDNGNDIGNATTSPEEPTTDGAPDTVTPGSDDTNDTNAANASARAAFGVLFSDVAERMANAETRELSKRAARSREDFGRFATWFAEFSEGHRGYVVRSLTPLASAWAGVHGGEVDLPRIAEAMERSARASVLAPNFAQASEAFIAGRPAWILSCILEHFTGEAVHD